jgi:hypothetical protein
MTIDINRDAKVPVGAVMASASLVTVRYPYSFMVLNPVANLVTKGSTTGRPITLAVSAEMRNEVQAQ